MSVTTHTRRVRQQTALNIPGDGTFRPWETAAAILRAPVGRIGLATAAPAWRRAVPCSVSATGSGPVRPLSLRTRGEYEKARVQTALSLSSSSSLHKHLPRLFLCCLPTFPVRHRFSSRTCHSFTPSLAGSTDAFSCGDFSNSTTTRCWSVVMSSFLFIQAQPSPSSISRLTYSLPHSHVAQAQLPPPSPSPSPSHTHPPPCTSPPRPSFSPPPSSRSSTPTA